MTATKREVILLDWMHLLDGSAHREDAGGKLTNTSLLAPVLAREYVDLPPPAGPSECHPAKGHHAVGGHQST